MSSSKRTLHFVLALMSALVLSPLSALAQSANNPRIALVVPREISNASRIPSSFPAL